MSCKCEHHGLDTTMVKSCCGERPVQFEDAGEDDFMRCCDCGDSFEFIEICDDCGEEITDEHE